MTANATPSNSNTANDRSIVIVGGGIAGAALATALACAGRRVLVLESTEVFRDRVRGESMMPWGVAEAQALGVANVLHAAGAHTAPLWKRYSEGDAAPRDLPVGRLVAGVGGSLNLHHPIACQALLDAATEAGATVLRGAREAVVVPGEHPTVTYRLGGTEHKVHASLVVGADGRGSVVHAAPASRLSSRRQAAMSSGYCLMMWRAATSTTLWWNTISASACCCVRAVAVPGRITSSRLCIAPVTRATAVANASSPTPPRRDRRSRQRWPTRDLLARVAQSPALTPGRIDPTPIGSF